MAWSQESEERSRLAVSQSGHGSRAMLEPDMEVMHSTESRLPVVQVLGSYIMRWFDWSIGVDVATISI